MCGHATEAINLWHDMDSSCLDKRLLQVLNSSYGCIVGIISRCGLVIKVHHRVQPNKSKLVYVSSHYSKSADKVKYYSIKVGCVAWMLYIYQVV